MEDDNAQNTHHEPEAAGSEAGELSSGGLLLMSLFSAVVYLGLSLLIFRFFREEAFSAAFSGGLPTAWQPVAGLGAGVAAAGMVWAAARSERLAGVLDDFYIVREIMRMRFSQFDRLQVSLFAGAGEELLFRGALQPLLGNGLTSLIFVGIHGYFKFRSPAHLLYGILMYGLSLWLGFLFSEYGLLTAMAAHAVYDVLMISWIQRR